MVIVLMGVSGSGKTTIGMRLAASIHAPFIDADDLHSQKNKAKMAAGHPLNDEDRTPWLQDLNQILRDSFYTGQSLVMACSALKEKYREILRAGMPEGAIHLIFLDLPVPMLVDRLKTRHHEFMNPELRESQLKTLEPPQNALRVMNDRDPEQVVHSIVTYLSDSANL